MGTCVICEDQQPGNARLCGADACIEAFLALLAKDVAREVRAHKRAVAALGPWGRIRYWFWRWMASSESAYYGDGVRWWHGGLTLTRRAWVLLTPALGASEHVHTLAEKFGRPL
jgi:hypothetical protein